MARDIGPRFDVDGNDFLLEYFSDRILALEQDAIDENVQDENVQDENVQDGNVQRAMPNCQVRSTV